MSYKEIKSRVNILAESGNVKLKGRLNYFTSREKGLLNCIPYDLYTLNEYFNFDVSQEVFSLKDVAFITSKGVEFNVFRGFNFSTMIIYDKNKKIFQEKPYDIDYYDKIMISQNIARVHRKRIEFDFKDFIRLIFGSALFVIFSFFIIIALILLPVG
jgi:hypothetical protein